MSNHCYKEEEQVDDMETKISFLDSFLCEDNNNQDPDCKDNTDNTLFSTTNLTAQISNNISFNINPTR